MTSFVPSGDQLTETLSPCSVSDVGVRVKYASTADGYFDQSKPMAFRLYYQRTRTRQTPTPFLVRAQNKDFLGLGARPITISGGRLGRGGTVESCRAAEVGKYIMSRLSRAKSLKTEPRKRIEDNFSLR
jgi:hypothetical protein